MKLAALYLSAVIILVFVLQTFFGITDEISLVSRQVFQKPWTLLSAIFAHGSVSHLLSNIFALAFFGLLLEGIFGWRKFLSVFFISGIIAGIASAFFYTASLGASGAVFGIIGALAALRPRMAVIALGVPMAMIIAAAAWALLDLAGMFYPGNIANAAHLAGLAAGIAFGIYFRKRYPEPKKAKTRFPLSEKEISEWEGRYMKFKRFRRL